MLRRFTLSLLLALVTALSAKAMSYDEARERAWFLTDKMAYELNLTPEQYDRAYEINLDYFLSLRTAADCYGAYWDYRDSDLRYVLYDWQYSRYASLEYFFRPICWLRNAWYYPIIEHYRRGSYFYDRPAIYISYTGRGWRRRSHNDPSPYMGMRFAPGMGMRDRYAARGGLLRPGDGKPGNGWHPDFGGGGRGAARGGNGNANPGGNTNNNRGGWHPDLGTFDNTARPGRNNGVVGSGSGANNSRVNGSVQPPSGNSGRGNNNNTSRPGRNESGSIGGGQQGGSSASPFRPAVERRVDNSRQMQRSTSVPATSTPSRGSVTPARGSVTPTRSTSTPSRGSVTPSRGSVTPSRSSGVGSRSGSTSAPSRGSRLGGR